MSLTHRLFLCLPNVKWALLFVGMFKFIVGIAFLITAGVFHAKSQYQVPDEASVRAMHSGNAIVYFFGTSFVISGSLATYGSHYEKLLPLLLFIAVTWINIGSIALSNFLVYSSQLKLSELTEEIGISDSNFSSIEDASLNVIWSIQRGFKCCGLQNSTDWLLIQNSGQQREILTSSCLINSSDYSSSPVPAINLSYLNNSAMHKEGCFEAFSGLLRVIHILQEMTLPTFIFVVIIDYIGMIFALIFCLTLSYARGIEALMDEKQWSPIVFFQDD